MTEHHPSVVRLCDVAVVGGSAAGLAAALQIQRQDRSTIVIDGGEPRNAPANHMHGYLGYDGVNRAELIHAGRAEVRTYGGEILSGSVESVVRGSDGRFEVWVGSVMVSARRVLAATGLSDDLSAVEGLDAHWGTSVIHCPFCHGYEVRGQRLVQLVTHEAGLHPARLFAHLSGRLTLIIASGLDVDSSELQSLESGGVTVVHGDAQRLVEANDGSLSGVELVDGSVHAADAVVITTLVHPRIEPFRGLGLEPEPHPFGLGDYIPTSPAGETAIEGLYAAGNLTDPSQQVLHAAANGSQVGAMIAMSLAAEDQTVSSQAVDQNEWDLRYSDDESVWSGSPNGALVQEVESMTPGRVLDVGAGEGGDAIWLAQQGWTVTATDIASKGLDRVAAAAEQHGVQVSCRAVDANALDAFGDETFDLVSLCYSAILRTGDDRAITNLMNAVAEDGTLFVVGHAPPAEGDGHSRPWDGAAFVGIDLIDAVVRATPGWTVVTNESRDRPPGSASHHMHDTDIVFRAHRTA